MLKVCIPRCVSRNYAKAWCLPAMVAQCGFVRGQQGNVCTLQSARLPMQFMLPFDRVHACQGGILQLPTEFSAQAVQQFRFMHDIPSMWSCEWIAVSWRCKQVHAAMFRHVSHVRDSLLMQLWMAILNWLPSFACAAGVICVLCLQGVAWVGGIGSSNLEKVVDQMRSNSEAIQMCTFYYISDAYNKVCTLGRPVGYC